MMARAVLDKPWPLAAGNASSVVVVVVVLLLVLVWRAANIGVACISRDFVRLCNRYKTKVVCSTHLGTVKCCNVAMGQKQTV